MSNYIGTDIDRYHIVELLGNGGMAVVFKALDTRLERYVALKIIRKEAFPPSDWNHLFSRFLLEAKALARLNHPNIVKVFDFGEHDNAPFIVMELLEGGTLKQRMGKLYRPDEAAKILAPIADGLDYAHGKGILHRDVKPSNILFNSDDNPVLTDFGIAKMLDSGNENDLTKSQAAIGTPEYISPEQGLGKKISGRSDEYSLGIIFYEMITGKKPFTGGTPIEIILKQSTEQVSIPEYLPSSVKQILSTVLEKEPEDRYPTVGIFGDELKKLIDEKPEYSHSGTGEETTFEFSAPSIQIIRETYQNTFNKLSNTSDKKPDLHEKNPNRKTFISVALVLFIILAGSGVFLFLKNQQNHISSTQIPPETIILTNTPLINLKSDEQQPTEPVTANVFGNTPQQTAEATVTSYLIAATSTFTAIPTSTKVSQMDTAAFTVIPTDTMLPPTATKTPVPTATDTPIPPTATNTPVPTATDTPIPPTATNTPVPTATDTPIPPTATKTPVPTATDTPIPPTATKTPVPTATDTPIPPTATKTPVPTATKTTAPTRPASEYSTKDFVKFLKKQQKVPIGSSVFLIDRKADLETIVQTDDVFNITGSSHNIDPDGKSNRYFVARTEVSLDANDRINNNAGCGFQFMGGEGGGTATAIITKDGRLVFTFPSESRLNPISVNLNTDVLSTPHELILLVSKYGIHVFVDGNDVFKTENSSYDIRNGQVRFTATGSGIRCSFYDNFLWTDNAQ